MYRELLNRIKVKFNDVYLIPYEKLFKDIM